MWLGCIHRLSLSWMRSGRVQPVKWTQQLWVRLDGGLPLGKDVGTPAIREGEKLIVSI